MSLEFHSPAERKYLSLNRCPVYALLIIPRTHYNNRSIATRTIFPEQITNMSCCRGTQSFCSVAGRIFFRGCLLLICASNHSCLPFVAFLFPPTRRLGLATFGLFFDDTSVHIIFQYTISHSVMNRFLKSSCVTIQNVSSYYPIIIYNCLAIIKRKPLTHFTCNLNDLRREQHDSETCIRFLSSKHRRI